MKISVIIPVYNEKDYILDTLGRVKSFDPGKAEKEIIVVDDGSKDGTAELLKSQTGIRLILSPNNQGKGAAVRRGFEAATGEILAIQDADGEYDPAQIKNLAEPVLSGQAAVVYGSRMTGHNPIGHWRYYFGNLLVSFIFNLFYRANLSDVETGHKVFLAQVIRDLELKEKGFGFEVELTAKILRHKYIIMEMPVGYRPRKFSQGKKIKWTDGLQAIWLIIKYRFSRL